MCGAVFHGHSWSWQEVLFHTQLQECKPSSTQSLCQLKQFDDRSSLDTLFIVPNITQALHPSFVVIALDQEQLRVLLQQLAQSSGIRFLPIPPHPQK
jgi:hypothetical protein